MEATSSSSPAMDHQVKNTFIEMMPPTPLSTPLPSPMATAPAKVGFTLKESLARAVAAEESDNFEENGSSALKEGTLGSSTLTRRRPDPLKYMSTSSMISIPEGPIESPSMAQFLSKGSPTALTGPSSVRREAKYLTVSSIPPTPIATPAGVGLCDFGPTPSGTPAAGLSAASRTTLSLVDMIQSPRVGLTFDAATLVQPAAPLAVQTVVQPTVQPVQPAVASVASVVSSAAPVQLQPPLTVGPPPAAPAFVPATQPPVQPPSLLAPMVSLPSQSVPPPPLISPAGTAAQGRIQRLFSDAAVLPVPTVPTMPAAPPAPAAAVQLGLVASPPPVAAAAYSSAVGTLAYSTQATQQPRIELPQAQATFLGSAQIQRPVQAQPPAAGVVSTQRMVPPPPMAPAPTTMFSPKGARPPMAGLLPAQGAARPATAADDFKVLLDVAMASGNQKAVEALQRQALQSGIALDQFNMGLLEVAR